MFNNILATVTTYFTYSVSMEYSIRDKKDLFFFSAQEMVENICPARSPGHDPLHSPGSGVFLQHGSPPWKFPALRICCALCEEPFLADVHILSRFRASGHVACTETGGGCPAVGLSSVGSRFLVFSARRPFNAGVWAALLDRASPWALRLRSQPHIRDTSHKP